MLRLTNEHGMVLRLNQKNIHCFLTNWGFQQTMLDEPPNNNYFSTVLYCLHKAQATSVKKTQDFVLEDVLVFQRKEVW